ncbi:MAG: cupredoxin domain-containing protein [Candidatus Paceibacterota bacterium]|jgi:plastocyanin domain-containing protein
MSKKNNSKKSNNSNISIIISILFAGLIIGGAIYFTSKNSEEKIVDNFVIIDGKQIIEIKAKGGYSPIHSRAKAGLPTILRIDTNGTFDCSSSVRIPSMNISQNLPLSGTTDIDIGIQEVGIFQGTCGMGMYPFDIKFE